MKSKLLFCLSGILFIHFSCKKSSDGTTTNKNPLNDGMIAYYPFNNDVKDESGNNYHLTSKGAVLTADRFGRTSNAYNFNGKDALMEIPKYTKATSIRNFTFSLWIKPQDNHLANIIAFNSDSTKTMTHSMQLFKSNGYYGSYNRIAKCVSTNGLISCKGLLVHQKISDPTGKWTHIVFGQANYTPFLYVNGQKLIVTGGGMEWTPISLADGGWIGTETDINGFHNAFYKGDLDDIRIYARAITEDEVQQLFTEKL